MSILDSIRKTLVPIHREGWPFIGAFALGTFVLGFVSNDLWWI